jgi:hypothetical protein
MARQNGPTREARTGEKHGAQWRHGRSFVGASADLQPLLIVGALAASVLAASVILEEDATEARAMDARAIAA